MSSIPNPYDRQASFTTLQTPEAPTVGQDLEAEFEAIEVAIDETQARLAEIQRDDGLLKNLSVHPDSLSDAVRAILAARNGLIRGEWAAATQYAIGDVISSPAGLTYISAFEHLSGSFDVDLANGRWLVIGSAGTGGGGGGPIGIADVEGLSAALAGKAATDRSYVTTAAEPSLPGHFRMTGTPGQVTLTQDNLTREIRIGLAGLLGEVNTASNIGSGAGVFAGKSGADLQFKSISAGTNITLSQTATGITINSTAAIGAEPSIGDKGDITVSGFGLIWTIDPAAVTYSKIQNVSEARLLGRGQGSGVGSTQEISIGAGLQLTGTTLSATGGGGGSLATLSDVDLSVPQEGEFLRYDAAFGWTNSVASVGDIAGFRQFYYTNPVSGNAFDGDVMQWDDNLSLWVNEAMRRPVVVVSSSSMTLGRSHSGKTVRSTSAGGITITLPLDSFNEGEVGNEGRVGQLYYIHQDQGGGVTFSPAGGVTVEYGGMTAATNVEDQLIEVYRIAPNRYLVSRLNSSSGGASTTFSSITDFGGVGNNITNNASAFAAAESSSYSRIYLPEGTFFLDGQQFTLTKHYYGPGRIRSDVQSSNTTAIANSGQANITVASAASFNNGDVVTVVNNVSATTETRTVLSKAGNVLTLTANLGATYPIGSSVRKDGTSSWAPGRFTWMTTRPNSGTGSDINFFYSGDTSRVDAEYFLLGSSGNNLRKGLSEQYFDSVTTPHFQVFQNFSGWSGTDARLALGISAGATSITVNDATGINIGNNIRLININTGFEETRTVTNKVGNVLTLSSGTGSAHPAGSFVGTGQRTMNPLYHQYFIHRGGGDSYAILARGVGAYPALAGQDHIFFTSTTGLFGGDLSANAPHQFLTGIEIDHKDLSNQCGAVGVILNFQRNNGATTRGEFWHGILIKSEGTSGDASFMDSGLCLIGSIRAGVDLANNNANFGSWRSAISMKRGDGIVFNSQTVVDTLASGLSNPYSLTARAIGSTMIRTNEGAGDPYDANAGKAGDLEIRVQDGLGSRLASTASPGASSVTVVSSARAQALVPGQSVQLFDPASNNTETRTVASVVGTTVTLTPALTNGYNSGSVMTPAGESNTARLRVYVRGAEIMSLNARSGVDLALSSTSFSAWRSAVSMKRGDGIVFNSLASGAGPTAIGSTVIRTNEGAADPYDANAGKAGDLEFRLQDGAGSRLSATASAGTSTLTLASSTRAQALIPGQSVVLFDPSSSNSETRTISSVSGATVTLGSALANTYTAGTVIQVSGENNAARFRFYVRGGEAFSIGNQITAFRQLNVQNPAGGEVTGLNLTNNTNITSHSFAAGGATALPATPKVYIPIKVDGVVHYIPAYN